MKKAILFIILIFLFNSFFASAQKVLTVDLDLIKKNINDKSSPFYYPALIQRFERGDTTLTSEQYKHIYYGHSFSENFSPYNENKGLDSFFKLYRQENFKDALPYALKAIHADPVNLALTYKILICYHVLEQKDSARFYAKRYYPLLDVIYDSGNGRSIQTAMVVTNVGDEYEILHDSKLKSTGQFLLDGPTDKLVLDEESQKKEPKIKELFFNVEISFGQMEKMFKDNPPTLPVSGKKSKKK
jgi:hypothetical protein